MKGLVLSNNELNELRFALRSGIIAALRYLNARTPHRFTGIFQYDGDDVRNLFLVDREMQDAQPWAPFPTQESYCAIVQDTGAPFITGNAHVDERIQTHPARNKVISYCGVPLRTEAGELYASLCHFDYKPIMFSDLDIDFVTEAAPYLVKALTALH